MYKPLTNYFKITKINQGPNINTTFQELFHKNTSTMLSFRYEENIPFIQLLLQWLTHWLTMGLAPLTLHLTQLILQQPHEVGIIIIIPLLQMREGKPRR